MTPSILNAAHGNAAACGAVLVAETPKLAELPPPDPARTEAGLALRRVRGRPFQKGNTAAAERGPSLTRIGSDPNTPEEQRRVHRKAASLEGARRRELGVQYGGTVSTGVRIELVAWARATAWSDAYYRAGDAVKGAALAEKASGHQLKAIGIAEREAAARPAASAETPPWLVDATDATPPPRPVPALPARTDDKALTPAPVEAQAVATREALAPDVDELRAFVAENEGGT